MTFVGKRERMTEERNLGLQSLEVRCRDWMTKIAIKFNEVKKTVYLKVKWGNRQRLLLWNSNQNFVGRTFNAFNEIF